MDRYALLIEASNVTGEIDLPGARNDVIAMRDYLMSPVGGSWQNEEIEVVNKPQLTSICVKLAFHSNFFCLVYFSGHGSEPRKGFLTVCLNDIEREVEVKYLRPDSEYGIVIMDCCRGSGLIEESNENTKIAHFTHVATQGTDENSRNVWDKALQKCIKNNSDCGIVEMISCSYNEEARETESPNAYGEYTHALLEEAKRWHRTAESNYYLPSSQVHKRVYGYMVRRGQHPCYSPESLKYPFAVKA